MLNCIPLFAFELQILVFRSNITILSRQQNNKIGGCITANDIIVFDDRN